MFECILVSLDGTRESEAVLPEIEKLLKIRPGKVVLLRTAPEINVDAAAAEMEPGVEHANELPGDEFGLLTNATEIDLRRYLERVAERLQRAGATTITEVSFNKPADEILFFANYHKADLIAMATHGRTGLDRLVHGSVTETVLRHAPCPMLLVRSQN